MAGLFGGGAPKQPTAAQPTSASGVTVQTSCYGKVIPVVIGTAKLAPNLYWYNDFTQSAVNSGGGGGGGGGGKGGGGDSGGGGTTSYTYSASISFCLCEGPIQGVGAIWQGNDATATTPAALGYTTFNGAYGQAPWAHLAGYQMLDEAWTVPLTAPYTVTVNYTGAPFTDGGVKYGSGEVLTNSAGVGPILGQYSQTGGTYTFSAADAGAPVTISYSAANQVPASEALGYSGFAHMDAAGYNMGSSATLPNHNVEAMGFFSNSVPGALDADPSLFANALWTDPDWGVAPAIPTSMIGDLSLYHDYCLATGLLVSALYSEQQASSQVLDDLTLYTNADVACISTGLTIIPRGDTVATGNGVTYTPPTFTFDLDDDDWLLANAAVTASGSNSGDPLVLTQIRPQDTVNQVPLQYLNRGNAYNPEPVTARNLAAIQTYGLNAGTVRQADLFALAAPAMMSAQLLLQRSAILNTWQGTVGTHRARIEPGDLGYIRSTARGLGPWPVRVKERDRQEDGSILLVMEDYVTGAGSAGAHVAPEGQGFAHDFNVDPGNVVDTVMFDAATQMTAGGLEIWLATCGGANWGGAQVWISTDDTTFGRADGIITGDARIGVLTAVLPAVADVDTTSTLAVSLSESGGTLTGGTQADVDAYATLCWVDGELIAYRDCTLTAANQYALAYLHRGIYGTPITAHAMGAKFVRLDPSIFRYAYTKDAIGKTVWVKLLSFNLYEGAVQTLDEVSSIAHTIVGPPLPPAPTGVSAQQAGNVVNFAWDSNPDFAMDIACGPQGCASGVTVAQAWSAMSMVTEAARGSYDANASIQPGSYTFGFRQRNTYSDQLSAGMVTVDLVVANAQSVIASNQQAPAWIGTLTGFIRHYSGVLIPDSGLLANQVTQAQAAAGFVPGAVATSTYDSPVIDTGAVDQIRLWATIAAGLGPGGLGNVNTSLLVDWSSDNITWQGVWRPWSVGTVTARYAKFRLLQDNSDGACVVTGFIPTADVSSKTDTGAGTASASPVTVASGGTAITFSQPFHAIPNVQTTAMGVGMTGATAVNITTTGCTLHGWTGSTDSGGSVSWKASGP